MNIEVIKLKLIKKYGTKPTICYYYYLWNAINYAGEEIVRKSFESIQGQGNEVIIGDYSSTDKTKQIAEEYGFRVLNIEKDPDYKFYESKIRNKVIIESNSNFLVPLNINSEYPKDLNEFIVEWIENNSINRVALKLRTLYESGDKYYGFSTVFYRPYLLKARGYDENTSYAMGSQQYGVMLLKNIYNLRFRAVNLDIIHKFHNHRKRPMLNIIFPNITYAQRRKNVRRMMTQLEENLQNNFEISVKKVKNSYW